MLVDILQNFDFGGRRYLIGDNPDVDPQIAKQWIGEGKAAASSGSQHGPAGAPVVNDLTTGGASAALSAQQGVVLNGLATKTPGSYATPSREAPLSAEATVTQVTCDWINLLASDGKSAITTSGGNTVGSGVNWQGNGIESTVTMSDGTQFVRYCSSAGDKLLRSPTGGGKNGSTWTVISTITGTMDYTMLLRDPTSDTLLYFVPIGSSRNWTMRCFAYNSAGTLLCQYDLPQYLGFLDGISTNSYYRPAIGADGRFVFLQPLQYWPAQSQQRTSTLGLATLIICGKYDAVGNSFSFDEPYRLYDDERWAYHTPFVGLNGDPDYVGFLCGRDVLNSEDTDPVTKLPGGDTGFFDFDQIGFGWYNRRTRQSSNGIKRITPRLGFMNSPCYAYVSWSSGGTSLTLNSIISGSIRWGQQVIVADNSGASVGTAYLGSSSGAVGSSIPLVTTMGGSTAIAALGASASNVLVKLIEPTGTVATPQKRFASMTVSNDGFIYAAYINSRHAGSASKALTGGNQANSFRILKVSAMGELIYDEELFSEGSTNGQNYHTTFQCNLTNALYLVRSVPDSSVGCTEVHFLKIFEKQSCSLVNVSTTSSSNIITVNSGANVGVPYLGMKIAGSGIPLDSYVIKWGTYNPTAGTGTVYLNNNATATASGVTLRGWARVCMEDRLTTNSINNVYGTNGSYQPNAGQTAIPQTLPARSAGFIPFIADNRSGSKETTNTVDMFMFRKENDWPTNSSPNGYLERLEHIHVRLPG
jgi:hypothetical protein